MGIFDDVAVKTLKLCAAHSGLTFPEMTDEETIAMNSDDYTRFLSFDGDGMIFLESPPGWRQKSSFWVADGEIWIKKGDFERTNYWWLANGITRHKRDFEKIQHYNTDHESPFHLPGTVFRVRLE